MRTSLLRPASRPGKAGSASRRAALVDAALYGGSAVVAVTLRATNATLVDREWAGMATGPYAAAAGASILLAVRGGSLRARTWLMVAVFAAVVLVPLGIEVDRRADHGLGTHAKSEVIVTELGATALLHGSDPYAARFSAGPLATWSKAVQSHVPYPPGLLAFGLPRAAGLSGQLGDARVAFAFVTILTLVIVAILWTGRPEQLLRAVQVLVVLAVGAPLLVTSGKEPPVLALLLLSVLLIHRVSDRAAGVVAGVAASMHQFAWPILPFLVRPRGRTRERFRAVAAALAVLAVAVVPFVLWNAGAFFEDVIRFPLLHKVGPASLTVPTPGALVAHAVPASKLVLAATALAVFFGTIALLTRRRIRVERPDPATAAGIALVMAMLFSPDTSLKYFVFPVNFLLWGWLLRPVEHAEHGGGSG